MALKTFTPRVLIIGGGLGGLALAQGLKQAKPPIPFHIFERDSTASFRAQGYRVRVADDLEKLLPPALFSAFEATSAKVKKGMNGLDALTGEPPKEPPMGPPRGGGGPPPVGDGRSYNADRTVLRNTLLQGLEDHISFDKRFERYNVLENGGVEAQFADGSVERGTLLVGVDGVRSLVRRQLMPDFKVLDSEGRAVFGKTDLDEGVASTIAKELTQGICFVGAPGTNGVKLFCDVMQFDRSNAASTDIKIPADYIYWVFCFRHDALASLSPDYNLPLKDLLSLSDAQSVDVGRQLSKHWHSSVRSILDKPNEGSTSTLAFYTCAKDDFLKSWATLRGGPAPAPPCVTILGDAAHPLPPIGGVGANSAFQEAADLCRALVDGDRSAGGQAEAVRRHERLLVERAKGTIERSAGGAVRFFGMKPVEELQVASF